MKHQVSIEIDAPIELVFDCANDDIAEWSPTVLEDKVVKETPEIVGTTFHMVTQERGKEMEFDGTVTRYDRPHVSAIRMTNPSFDIESTFSFEALSENRTRVVQDATAEGKGFFRVVMFVMGLFMGKGCKAAETELACLKKHCEDKLPTSAG